MIMALGWAGWLAVGLALAPISLKAQTPAETRVTVGELIGLDPVAVRTRMAGLPVDWTMVGPALSLMSEHEVLDFRSSADLTRDPVEAEQEEHYNSGDFGHSVRPHLECRTFVGQPDAADNRFGTVLTLRFTDGRLSAIYNDRPWPPAPPMPLRPDGRPDTAAIDAAHQAAMRSPRPTPFIAAPGQLPLQDGDAFIGRWSKDALAADVGLTTRCAPWQAVDIPKSKGSGNQFPDLSLLPLAIFEPPTNAARSVARRNGQAVLKQFKLGAPLGQSLDAFTDVTSGVRVFRNPDGDYAVIVLDMGALPSNHLDNMDDVAMIGVKAGVVAWIMPSGWRANWPLQLSANLLCLDDHFVVGKVRPGCDAEGTYRP
jgi:hypothetical protein